MQIAQKHSGRDHELQILWYRRKLLRAEDGSKSIRGIPVATRIKNVPSVSVPKLPRRTKAEHARTYLGRNRCRNTSVNRQRALQCARTRAAAKDGAHTRVARKSSKYWSTVFAIAGSSESDPHEGNRAAAEERRWSVHQQISVVVKQIRFQGSGLAPGLRFFLVLLELVPWHGHAMMPVRLPCSQAARCVHTALSEK